MNIKKYIRLVLLGIFLFPVTLFSQVDFNRTPDDDLGDLEDKYQEYFFEALKQKGIENYDRAVKALLKCVSLDDSHSVVHFELGKNYVQLQDYSMAEQSLKKAIAMDPDNEWYLDELYGVYAELNDYDNALKTVKQLVSYHPDYKEDLANLYFRNQKYNEALKLLDELDGKLGVSEARDQLRNEIYNATGADDSRIENLEQRLANNPGNESNYLNLIYRYSEKGDSQKAFEMAKSLLAKMPKSQLVHLALYKFYLENNEADKAITSMKVVLNSGTIDNKAKGKVLNDFVNFVKANPQYENELLEITTDVVDDTSGKSDAELGDYYLMNNDKVKAHEYFSKALYKDANNFDILKNVLLLKLDLKQYSEAVALSNDALNNYPSQPILYLVNGVANNNLNQPKKAISSLEIGIDYIIDDVSMEADFYKQLSVAYKLNNNITKSEAFSKKARNLIDQND
ncbi:MAG: tetratricopeptide repeat protein [Bacteroidia bacterium]|nr:tetratricopeptide repeat protein [Bacteroidia bacterium]NND25679.1 tetratricopeptide repeat protein [Flavobacteriaceae bacterium]MBT8279255.1 tetratricopeptide repeat protein [Bacteroidia bacterium]NNK59791.1 tetratricopeptide repeat protein [Flavobacteriaceae bacterium]NNL32055.1 tetratricopeptide repeat protein [Flavobacteriaceae bacterium]